ncbi:hypothetical protein [Massilia brevitalea]|uniref:hypothetical protein n=1 Tax=Massilia brevitalea TaxID=442526 RepID=UPI002738AFB2|nr:hypothetical protein [Massilia brevitalea]
MKSKLQAALPSIVETFLDPEGLDNVARYLKIQEIITVAHFSVFDLVETEVIALSNALDNPNSSYYQLKHLNDFIFAYLSEFDVHPVEPDIIKYTWAFGETVLQFAKDRNAANEMVFSVIRMNTVRCMIGAALAQRQGRPPSKTGSLMLEKIRRSWCHDRHLELFGPFGSYMTIKIWSAG